MAQIKRKKVARKTAQGQKIAKNSIFKNKFLYIWSLVAIVLITCGIVGGIHVYNKINSEDDAVDYFTKEYTADDGAKITFDRLTYEGVKIRVTQDIDDEVYYKKHIFFMIYDSTNFYPDKSIDNGKDKDSDDLKYKEADENVLNGLIDIQREIDKYNATILADDPDNVADTIALYIIDTQFGNNKNALSDSLFGKQSDATFVFGYINGVNGFTESYKDNDGQTKTLWTISQNTFFTTTVSRVINFIGMDLESK